MESNAIAAVLGKPSAPCPTPPKVNALAANPKVALTADGGPETGRWPPRMLLVRGSAELRVVDGVPDVYLAASRKVTPESEWDAWVSGVRALYQEMAIITIVPEWAKLLDFETTIPQAVEELVKQAR